MDRTALFNSTTTAAVHRLEERQFGDQIHGNLMALALHHRPSDELLGLLSADMFVKPNSRAFAHCAQYLFNILDPREFRRSFYWPCRDKAGESQFRTAAVQLMNTLIERHQMPLEPVKMHSVVLPGGLKFMRVLFEFTVLAMREVAAKQQEDQVPQGFNIEAAFHEHREFQANALKYMQKLDINLTNIRTAQRQRELALDQLTAITDADLHPQPFAATLQITDDFLQRWRTHLDTTFDTQLAPAAKRIMEFGQLCSRLAELVQRITGNQHKRCVAIDPAALSRCQERLLDYCTSTSSSALDSLLQQPLSANNEYDLCQVIALFEAVLPAIASHIATIRYRPICREVATVERQLIAQMLNDVTALKLDSDAQLQLTESHFEWATQRYPFDWADLVAATAAHESAKGAATPTAAVAASVSGRPLDIRSRFLCTPAVRVKSAHATSNPIISSHLPWTFEEQQQQSAAVLADTTGRRFNRPATPGKPGAANQTLNDSRRGAGGSSALSMLSRVRDRCKPPANKQQPVQIPLQQSPAVGQSPAPASRQRAEALVQMMKAAAAAGSRTPTSSRLVASASKTSAQRTTCGSTSTTTATVYTEQLLETHAALRTPDSFVVHQRLQTNQVIHLHSADGAAATHRNFLRTSPSGRFLLNEELVCDPQSPLTASLQQLQLSANPAANTATPSASESSTLEPSSDGGGAGQGSSDASFAAITARQICFSPAEDETDDAENTAIDDASSLATARQICFSPDVRRVLGTATGDNSLAANSGVAAQILSPGLNESLFNVSDTVLQDITI